MTSHTDLSSQLASLGLRGAATTIDELLAKADREHWQPIQLLEQLIHIEGSDRSRRSLERRQARSKIGVFKPMADFDWNWPTEIDRPAIERTLQLPFIKEGVNLLPASADSGATTVDVVSTPARDELGADTTF